MSKHAIGLSKKQLEIVTAMATKTATEEYSKLQKQQKKKDYSWRLRNVKLLLKNYRNLKLYCDDVVKDLTILEPFLNLMGGRTLDIKSLTDTEIKTELMMKYVDSVLQTYEKACTAGTVEDSRRYRIVRDMYLNPKKLTAEKVSEKYHIDRRTVYKEINKASETLGVLMFGVDGIEDIFQR
ncbi:hypothetical protein JJT34_002221 [Listeria monocytogenes]|uniref:hypothetical protein n=1 Tax=Listeria ivanovii TaxID=1638 RepID=UPI001D4598EF|nr:hypothetical protein [Listeria monocytogenes]EFU8667270.1 hypothetical protein [Listeria monocytogenes]EGN8719836.1 hypothetical protein [Listeria monocytogenes]EGU0430476.1 hypothetical protein [Listeria monocytogenes]EHA0620188.1 hypothetical protein [Listeria monocytogenes]